MLVALPFPEATLYGLWGTSAQDIWATGASGGIWHFDGTVWESFGPVTRNSFSSVTGSSDKDVWFAGQNGLLYHWDGQAAEPVDSGVTVALNGVWESSGTGDGWGVGASGAMLRLTGGAWTPISGQLVDSLGGAWSSRTDALWVVGGGGTLGRHQLAPRHERRDPGPA